MIRTILIGFILICGEFSFAQQYDCLKNFQFVKQHIETNYPGFKDKVNSENLSSYLQFKEEIETRMQDLKTQEDCINVINQFIAFFRDGHIQIFRKNSPIENYYLYPKKGSFNTLQGVKHIDYRQLTSRTVYLRIGSFNEREFNSIDSIAQKNHKSLKNSDNIILDLRGNEGGATFTYQPILPFLGLDSIQHIGFDVLATEDNIAAYQRLLESPYMPENQKPYINRNIQLMKQNIGKLTSLSDDYIESITKNEKPQSIIVLIDNNCGSTTEHFLFIAKQSKKVTIMGEPTIGMYDYGDMRSFLFPDPELQLWCATNRSRRLNTGGGIDNIGIQPDIPLNKNKDWIDEAILFLEQKNNHLQQWLKRQ